jgi:hypothetical protein
LEEYGREKDVTEEEVAGITKFVTCSADRTVRFWTFVDPLIGISQ